jgi:lipoyl(octanoyl) transferase
VKKIQLIQTGISRYRDLWKLQKDLFQRVMDNRRDNFLILTEHYPVITVGQKNDPAHLLVDEAHLAREGIELLHIDRGGDATFHGPGQLVGYPILNLLDFNPDIHWYLRALEEVIIRTLSDLGIPAQRIPDLTGVWIENKKICAIGVKITRWITMHGFALNVTTDLDFFKLIVPCGLSGKGVTSIAEQIGNNMGVNDVSARICVHFAGIFDAEISKIQPASLLNKSKNYS